jgi:hypothetical protein
LTSSFTIHNNNDNNNDDNNNDNNKFAGYVQDKSCLSKAVHYMTSVGVPKALVLHGQASLHATVPKRKQCCAASKAAGAEGYVNCFAALQPLKFGMCVLPGPTCVLACALCCGHHCDGCLNRQLQGRI